MLADLSYYLVIHIYSKGGGNHGVHGWIPSCDTIGKISYLSVQLFEPWYGDYFRVVPERNLVLNAKEFCHLPGQCWLCRVPGNVIMKREVVEILVITKAAHDLFMTFQKVRLSIVTAYKAMRLHAKKDGTTAKTRKKGKKGKKEQQQEGEKEGEKEELGDDEDEEM